MSYAESFFLVRPASRDGEINELDEIALLENSLVAGREYKAGQRGIVVAVWNDGEAFDVEFRGFDTLALVKRNQIGLVRTAE